MAKKTKAETPKDDGLQRFVTWINESDDATQETRNLAEKSRDYYDSNQWTAAEKAVLAGQKQAPTVRNRIKPKMDGLMGMERSNKTTAKAYPRTPKHDQAASAATEAVRFVLDDNAYHQKRSAAWENLLIEGSGAIEVIAEPKKGGIKVKINSIMWDRMIYDPHSRRKDFSDARYLGQIIWMDYDEAVDLYPESKDILEDMINGSQTYDDKPRWMDDTRKRVKIVELYYHSKGNVYYTCFTRGGFIKTPKISPYRNEEGETEWPYEFASLFVTPEGDRYGACRQLLDIQDEINKRGSKALHLMSVRQIRLERGAVDDVNKTRQELAKPDGVVETTPGMEFEVLKTGDMAAGQFNLLAEAKQEIDAISYSAAAAGKDVRLMSGIALQQRQATSQTELAPMFDVLKHLDIRVYRKVWNRIKQYWKDEMWVRVTDDPTDLKWVGLNKPITQGEMILKQAQEQGAPPEALQELRMRIMQDPMMQQVVSMENDIANLDVDIVMADAPDAVTQQIEDFQVLGEMVKSGFPMPPKAVIEASPLSNKDRILKMMDEQQPQIPPEVEQQLQQMQDAVKQLEEENQALKQDQQLDMMKAQSQAQIKAAELELEQQNMQAEFALKKQAQEQEIQLAREKAIAEIQLEREIAEAKMGLENKKVDDQMRIKETEWSKESEAKEKAESVETTPKAIEAVKKITEEFANVLAMMQQTMQQNAQFQAEIIESINKPKAVRLGNIKRSPDGMMTGAEAITVQ